MNAKVDVLAVMADSAHDARAAFVRAQNRGPVIYTEKYLRALEEAATEAEAARNRVADLIAAAQQHADCAEVEGFVTDAVASRLRAALAACGVQS